MVNLCEVSCLLLNIRKVQIIHSLYGPHRTESNHVIDCVKAQQDPETDIEIVMWDKIVVPRSFWSRVFHSGEDRLTNGLSQ